MLRHCCCMQAPSDAEHIEFDLVGEFNSMTAAAGNHLTLLQQRPTLTKQPSSKGIGDGPSATLARKGPANGPSPRQSSNVSFHLDEEAGIPTGMVPCNEQHPVEVDSSEKRLTVDMPKKDDLRLLKAFANKAKEGCRCVYVGDSRVPGSWGKRSDSHYTMDAQFQCLTMVLHDGEIACSVDRIMDIYSLPDDGEDCFPLEVIRALNPEDLELLLMIVCSGSSPGDSYKFCFVEQSCESRDALLDCLRIVSLLVA